MKNKKNSYLSGTFICFLFPILLFSSTAYSQVRLPKLISDGMVLQRDIPSNVWGWASPGEQVSLHFRGQSYRTTTGLDGQWMIHLPAQQAGGPCEMVFSASNEVVVRDILFGDVWICSGQSNMELSMKRVSPLYPNEMKKANNASIRYFYVPQTYNFNDPQKDLKSGNWQRTTPESVFDFSAVAYFFAKELYDKYQVPIGLINASLGGSPAESWMSEEALKQFPGHYQEVQKFKDSTLILQIQAEDQERIQAWYNELNQQDEGYKIPGKTWSDPTLNTSGWDTMEIPGYWENTGLGRINGAVWFRKEIEVPQSMDGKPAKLLVGTIVDADSVFVNGVFVGNTTYQYPPRRYDIPEGILLEGKNIITIRVVNNTGAGGFVSDKPYEISCGNQTIDLKGIWQYKLGAAMKPLKGETFIRWKPAGLFNAMVSPLLNYKMKGVIWYQGESNTGRAEEYRTLFPAMIRDWRTHWNQGDFPFLFVQLPHFMKSKPEPSESGWAALREAQLQTLSVPNTGMAVTIDIGEWNDVHPLNKQDVGKRLALAARKMAYGDQVVYSGPIYKSMKVEGHKIILSFTQTGSGLTAKGGQLKAFAIAGENRQFVWANAKIENKKVIVWSDKITNPVAVRYAWADNPENANLCNKEGLPASPFRTDE